jgi:signal transduction histidine kinase
VLDLSKIEAGQLEVRAQRFSAREAAERAAASVKPLAEEKGLALRVELPLGLPPLESDRRRVEQVLLNLLNNAIKFTDRGEVALRVWRQEPAPAEPSQPVPATAPAAWLHFEVADTGIGIKPEDLAALFKPFGQLDTGLTRQHEGTGLGLAICRRLARLLGGEIAVRREWGKGSVFTLTLPHYVLRTSSPCPP